MSFDSLKRALTAIPGSSSAFAEGRQSLLTNDQQQDDDGSEEEVEEEGFSVQALVNFHDVDGLVKNSLAENVTLLKNQGLVLVFIQDN